MRYVTYTKENASKWQRSLIDCHKAVFAAEPWNEDWWTDNMVLSVLKQYGGPNARIILAIENSSVIGFSWGAVFSGEELNIELEIQLPILSESTVGYVKDIGVTEAFRNQGIAQILLEELVSTLRQSCQASDWIYARTLAWPEPSVVYRWFPTIGFQEVGEYLKGGERSGQVILGCSLDSLQT